MKIYVGNLPWSIGDAELSQLFETYGPVTSASVVADRDTGRSRGFGFVEMADDTHARGAIDGLANHEIDSRTLNVSEARPRPDRGSGGGGGRGGRGGDRW